MKLQLRNTDCRKSSSNTRALRRGGGHNFRSISSFPFPRIYNYAVILTDLSKDSKLIRLYTNLMQLIIILFNYN